MKGLSWKQGLGLWMGTAGVVAMALAWLRMTAPPDGFIQEPDQAYDYIIVGAGTSGCVLAAKLSARNHRVLLIEAGGEPPWYSWIPLIAPILQGSSHDWRYRTVPQRNAAGALHNRESFWPQGKMVGGSGQMNFLIHTVGSPADYDSWNLPGWDSRSMKAVFDRLTCLGADSPARRPFALDEDAETCAPPGVENSTSCGKGESATSVRQCQSAAIKLDRVNETESPLTRAFIEAGRISGLVPADLNQWRTGSNDHDGAAIMASQNTIDGALGRRWSSYESHLLPALKTAKGKKRNLHVLTRSVASRLLWRNNRIVGVQYVDASGQEKRVDVRKEILLSAGSIRTPQILQLSGIGPAHVLEPLDIPVKAELPVGENLQDHLQVPLFVELDAAVSHNLIKMIHPGQLWNFWRHGKGVWAESGIEGIARLANDRGMLILFNMGSINADVYTSVANIKKEAFHQWFPKSGNLSQEGFVLISLCLHPLSRGHIRIRSTDPTQQPEIDPAYLSHPYDAQCTIDVIRQGVQLISTEPFRALGARIHWPSFPECGIPDGSSQKYMECLVRMAALTMYHPVGTSAMGCDDPGCPGVVNTKLRVRGVQGLRVVDASVFPSLTSGPPNSVLVALAEKASEMIMNERE